MDSAQVVQHLSTAQSTGNFSGPTAYSMGGQESGEGTAGFQFITLAATDFARRYCQNRVAEMFRQYQPHQALGTDFSSTFESVASEALEELYSEIRKSVSRTLGPHLVEVSRRHYDALLAAASGNTSQHAQLGSTATSYEYHQATQQNLASISTTVTNCSNDSQPIHQPSREADEESNSPEPDLDWCFLPSHNHPLKDHNARRHIRSFLRVFICDKCNRFGEGDKTRYGNHWEDCGKPGFEKRWKMNQREFTSEHIAFCNALTEEKIEVQKMKELYKRHAAQCIDCKHMKTGPDRRRGKKRHPNRPRQGSAAPRASRKRPVRDACSHPSSSHPTPYIASHTTSPSDFSWAASHPNPNAHLRTPGSHTAPLPQTGFGQNVVDIPFHQNLNPISESHLRVPSARTGVGLGVTLDTQHFTQEHSVHNSPTYQTAPQSAAGSSDFISIAFSTPMSRRPSHRVPVQRPLRSSTIQSTDSAREARLDLMQGVSFVSPAESEVEGAEDLNILLFSRASTMEHAPKQQENQYPLPQSQDSGYGSQEVSIVGFWQAPTDEPTELVENRRARRRAASRKQSTELDEELLRMVDAEQHGHGDLEMLPVDGSGVLPGYGGGVGDSTRNVQRMAHYGGLGGLPGGHTAAPSIADSTMNAMRNMQTMPLHNGLNGMNTMGGGNASINLPVPGGFENGFNEDFLY